MFVSYIKKNCPDVDVVAGIEARGFLFGMIIAAELGISFVPIRKKGKLPGECISVEYVLEYGTVSTFLQFIQKLNFLINVLFAGYFRDSKR